MIIREAENKRARQARRRKRIRKKVVGTSARPRLSVARTVKHMHVQIIDDASGKLIAHVTTTSKNVEGKTKTERAKSIGKQIAALAVEKGIKKVVFDRGGRMYHGRVKAVADGAREGGLEF
ncbi:TPA: 50S ribosomal protein L18 [bacterium]|nr:MAG: 50S ribosomal protein L18 [Candidatus Hydrogenedentes bacterium CG1_02_42_14]PIU47991.1 MAG: 50S ribosomal protein L18 [Candidatus Hydrogenedentes bacterium CG07_land_8_20_14_0_80_42_17]HBW46657.1 50S ribosomal protein L18 [bacterium]